MEAKRHVAGPLRRIVLAATLAAFLVSLSGLRSPVVAVTAPPYSHSWYVTDPSNAAMTALGASDAAFDNSHCTDSFVILDFGQPMRDTGTPGGYDYYGTYYLDAVHGYPSINDSAIGAATKAYMTAWYNDTTSCPRLHLMVGTNNQRECPHVNGYVGCTVYNAGVNWAKVQQYIQNTAVANNWSWQVTGWAADDIEVGWDTYAKTKDFWAGFNAQVTTGELLDYGDAWYNQQDWTDAHIHEAAYGIGAQWPFPEIYSQSAADRWATVDTEYSMYFRGVLSTTVGNSPSNAWLDLWNTLNADGVGQTSLEAVSKIAYQ